MLPYAGNVSAETQRVWLELFVPMIMSKPAVQALVWNELHDLHNADLPNGGLLNANASAKPAFAYLESIRAYYFG